MAYITVQQMRDEGVTDPPYSNPVVEDRIALAQALIERILECFFEKRDDLTFKLDGTGHDFLSLPVPPVSVSSITAVKLVDDDGNEEEYETTDYEVVMDSFPDGRFDPRLWNKRGTWPKGTRNIWVTGDFGLVDDDGQGGYTTPVEIQRLCKLITNWGLPPIGDGEARRSNQIVEESLKDYRYRLSEAERTGMFGDPEIDGIFAMFRLPAMGAL